ncbi:hypothetical protein B7703_06255 [Streptococcus mitis]|nr:hypothetical protein B7703_06255 [Streptococcus mitis]
MHDLLIKIEDLKQADNNTNQSDNYVDTKQENDAKEKYSNQDRENDNRNEIIKIAGKTPDWKQFESRWNYLSQNQTKTGVLYQEVRYSFNNSNVQTGWVKRGDSWYYLDSSGAIQTGWVKSSGLWYYLDSLGAMQTGWVKSSGLWYYLDSSGAMQTGWVKSSGLWYYLDNNSGVMKRGWLQDNGTWYYLNQSGIMQTSWFEVNGKWYYADNSGAILTNTTTPDGYRVNDNGEWI